ncbi:MAG: TetR/AcrR family transcriptional regulator [Leptospira sp.]|nr:TetR/AcrR family transcriptional regulator [Leptospira sp.]
MNEKEGPRERLVAAAKKQFIERGFESASTNDILELARSHKGSMYRYFSGKEELGVTVLESISSEFLDGLRQLAAKTGTWEEFVNRWIRLLMKQVNSGKFRGCPLSRFINGVPSNSAILKKIGKETYETWAIGIGKIRLDFTHETNASSAQIKESGHRILRFYEGGAQSYLITEDNTVWISLKNDLLQFA